MSQIIRWYREQSDVNIVVYPENTETLQALLKAFLPFFPDARPLEGYRFPAMISQKNLTQLYREIDSWGEIPPCPPSRFRAACVILQDNHLLVGFRPAGREDAYALDDLLGRISAEKNAYLVMPVVWLPSGKFFPEEITELFLPIFDDFPLEITVRLDCPKFLLVPKWRREWGNAFGVPQPIRDLDVMFPNIEYEIIPSDADDCRADPCFQIPKGYWYCTSSETLPKRAPKDLRIYQSDGYVKMVNPETDPPTGSMYIRISSEKSR